MKNKTNIEYCKRIIERGDCEGDCTGDFGSFMGFRCPFNQKGEYDCWDFESPVDAAKKFLKDHEEEYDLKEDLVTPEERIEINIHNMKKGWFWDNDSNLVKEGFLVQCESGGYIGLFFHDHKPYLISYKNYSDKKPNQDTWVKITVEQGFKLLNTEEGIVKGQMLFVGSWVGSWVDAELDFVSDMFHTQDDECGIIDSGQFRVRKSLLIKHGLIKKE